MGRSLLRTWLLRPSLSISVIRSRQDAVACFLRSENVATSNAMHNHLKGLKNVPRLLGLIKDGRAKLSDWQGLVKVNYFQFLNDVLKLRLFLSSLRSVSRCSEMRCLNFTKQTMLIF